VAKALIQRLGGVQYVFSGTALGQVFVSVTAYQPGHTNSNKALRQDLSNALTDFSLTGSKSERPQSHIDGSSTSVGASASQLILWTLQD
jgi:hypothetical protein